MEVIGLIGYKDFMTCFLPVTMSEDGGRGASSIEGLDLFTANGNENYCFWTYNGGTSGEKWGWGAAGGGRSQLHVRERLKSFSAELQEEVSVKTSSCRLEVWGAFRTLSERHTWLFSHFQIRNVYRIWFKRTGNFIPLGCLFTTFVEQLDLSIPKFYFILLLFLLYLHRFKN